MCVCGGYGGLAVLQQESQPRHANVYLAAKNRASKRKDLESGSLEEPDLVLWFDHTFESVLWGERETKYNTSSVKTLYSASHEESIPSIVGRERGKNTM